MSKSLHARLVAYRPFGARIGVLAEPVSFSASMLHDDDGAISIEYSMLSGDAQAFDRELTDGLEVAVEVSDGTGYREPDNARYVITGRSGKTDDRGRQQSAFPHGQSGCSDPVGQVGILQQPRWRV